MKKATPSPAIRGGSPAPPDASPLADVDARFPIVAVGASAGGLEAFTRFLQIFPADSGMAIIIVQHLDPLHQSMMVGLLAPHTKMPVREATHGLTVERDTVYMIAPGTSLAINAGLLMVAPPNERHGARLPFDYLLRSLAEERGEAAFGVVLSGNGADGSLGLKAVSDRAGFTIAQNPKEAAHSGMPQAAIDMGFVDLVLPLDKIPEALVSYAQKMRAAPDETTSAHSVAMESALEPITDLLKARTKQDFTAYKPGTLTRRIRRRMAIHSIDGVDAYIRLLKKDAQEAEVLAKDLLIHVTSFFRDKAVFDHLATVVIPELIRDHPAGQPVRIWVPACSTGEEVYSLAMIFLEEIAAAKKMLRLQMFGTDIDVQAIATAREGRYPAGLRDELSPERLARFFVVDAGGYRIAAPLREAVVFTVQDVLTDPPFARIDFLSCRNLLIYLLPEAQHRVLSLLHFALNKNAVLLLGIAESVGALREDFASISDELRVFRRVGIGRKVKLQLGATERPRMFWPRPMQLAADRSTTAEELSHRLLMDTFAPASVLVNQRYECLYYFGPTERFLQIPTGDAGPGLLAMVRPVLRNKLRVTLQRARVERVLVSAAVDTLKMSDGTSSVRIEVRPVISDERDLYLVSFIETPEALTAANDEEASTDDDGSRIAILEKAVEGLQKELLDAAREIELSSADQEAINEEAESLNEEYQSTNEELETSKEELQSLNEELSALNSQLSATVNQQRDTADDLENILRSSDLAIVFLDSDLNIRFFSTAAKELFRTIDTDLGRPIGDLALKFDDPKLISDVNAVLQTLSTVTREVLAHNGDWYSRGILPYRTRAGAIQGVVLTFGNISVMKAAEFKIGLERTYAISVIDTVHQPLVVVDQRLRIVSSNRAFRNAFGLEGEDTTGRRLTAVGRGQLDLPAMHNFLDRAQSETAPIENCEIELDARGSGRRSFLLSSRKLAGDSAEHRILIVIEDITERKGTTEALKGAKLKAEKANLGKSRFLAAASHDLRQPLQTLSLLHGMLARKVTDPAGQTLIGKLNETLGAMAGMLDTLLDINQLEAGTVQPEIDDIVIGPILERLRSEFSYVAKSKGIALHVVDSTARVRTDPLLLSQMTRNLMSNAVKYTKRGKILVGCRRRGGVMRIEVWDTGIGIPSGQLEAIFEEYHQLGNPARERGLGLGLGLSIVQRIGELLGHKIVVHSDVARGSGFIVEVPLTEQERKRRGRTTTADSHAPALPAAPAPAPAQKDRTILIVEDDPAVRDALQLLFTGDGYRAVTAVDGLEVTALLNRGSLKIDIIVADYNLPGGRTGLEVIADLRVALGREIPAVILTGDIAADVLRKVVAADCSFLHKPVNVDQLSRCIEDLIATYEKHPVGSISPQRASAPDATDTPTIFIVDDDEILLESMRDMLRGRGHTVETHNSGEAFLAALDGRRSGCLIVDSVMPGMSGLDLLRRLKVEGRDIPAIVITGYGDIPMAIKAMQVGAMDFIEKPAKEEDLLASVARAMTQDGTTPRSAAQEAAAAQIAVLTRREREVMDLVVAGAPNKHIAAKMNISQRTVEAHRAAVMKRTGAGSLAELIRLVMQAG